MCTLAAAFILYIDQIIIHDFYHRFPYCVHSLYPKHLIVCFERFRDAFLLGEFFYQSKEHILCLLVQIGKVAIELSAEQQAIIQLFTVLMDI